MVMPSGDFGIVVGNNGLSLKTFRKFPIVEKRGT